MSDRTNSPPFDRGETYYGGTTIDTANLQGVNYEGQEKVFEDINYGSTSPGAKPARTGKPVRCRCVRNMSGIALLPKRLVQIDDTNPGRVTGYSNADSQHAFPVDEYLPTTGVPHGDLFWLPIKGPAMCLTPLAGAAQNADIAAGDRIHSATVNAGSTLTSTTTGRVAAFNTLAATTIAQFNSLLAFVHNYVGRAITAKTTAQTGADILIDIKAD